MSEPPNKRVKYEDEDGANGGPSGSGWPFAAGIEADAETERRLEVNIGPPEPGVARRTDSSVVFTHVSENKWELNVHQTGFQKARRLLRSLGLG
jgi:hypothetical protein